MTDTVPIIAFGQVVDAVATRMGWDPIRLQSNQAAALTVYLNAAMETVWNFADWPEAMRCELLPVNDNLIPWQANPITTRIITTDLTTNGLFEASLLGWTNSGTLWQWQAGTAVFSCTQADATAAEAGLFQTVTGLTIGRVYRLTLDLTLPAISMGDFVKVKAESGATVLHLSAALTKSTLYTADFTATATTAKISIQLFPTNTVMVAGAAPKFTGQAAQFTLHDTALIRIAPRPPLDMVRGVFGEDPLSVDAPVTYSYRLGPGCLHLLATARDVAEAWVLYRPLPPVYTSSLYSDSTTYQNGGLNSLAYDTTSGHVYRALPVDPFTAQALTNTAYWEIAGVPARWKEALIRLATADALEEQDQYAKATRLRAQAMDLMENAALTHYHQSGQTKNYRTPIAA